MKITYGNSIAEFRKREKQTDSYINYEFSLIPDIKFAKFWKFDKIELPRIAYKITIIVLFFYLTIEF